MPTDNRTNEPTPEQVEAAARAIWERYAGHGLWETLPAARKAPFLKDARAALEAAARAAQGAAPARPVIDREKLIDVLAMTDLSDYAGTDMRAINQCADAILAHLAADTGGQRDA